MEQALFELSKSMTISRSMPRLALQRKCACGNHTVAGGECAECRKKRLQLKAADHSNPETVPPIVHEVLRSTGRPLDVETRTFMEPRFGHDFSGVRVHTDTKAAESAQAVNALAYTVGRDIVFGTEQYTPHTSAGKKLMAHELVHTVQQGSSVHQLQAHLEISHPQEASEQEADSVASALAQGLASTTARREAPRIARQQARGDAKPPENSPVAEREGGNGEATRGEGDSRAVPLEASAGVCFRTPVGPGQVRFSGCTSEQLGDYAVIPESGTTLTTPVNGTAYDSDGFWFRHHSPRTEWFKVGNHCDLDVTCEGNDFSYSVCCNVFASLFRGTPGWTRATHGTTNPF